MAFKDSNTKGIYKKLTFGILIGKAVNTPVSIFIAKLFGVLTYGKLTLYNTTVSYFSHSHMGTLTNLNREVLFDFNKGDNENAALKINNVFSLYISVGLILSLLYTLCDLLMIAQSGLGKIVLILPFTVLTKACYTLFYSTLKAYGQFDVYSNMDLINKTLLPIFTLLGVLVLNIYGFILAVIIVDWISIVVNYRKSFHRFKYTINKEVIKSLLMTGSHMYINKIIDILFVTITVLYLSKEGRLVDLGIFGFAFAMFNINKLPFVLPYVITTSRDFTVGYESRSLAENQVKLQNYTSNLVMINILIASGIFIVYDVIIEFFLRDYYESLEIMLIMFPGLVIYNLRYVSFMFFDVIGKFGRRTILSLVSCTLYILYLLGTTDQTSLLEMSSVLSCLFAANGLVAHFMMLYHVGSSKRDILKLIALVMVSTVVFTLLLKWYSLIPLDLSGAWQLVVIFCVLGLSLFSMKWLFRDYSRVKIADIIKLIKS